MCGFSGAQKPPLRIGVGLLLLSTWPLKEVTSKYSPVCAQSPLIDSNDGSTRPGSRSVISLYQTCSIRVNASVLPEGDRAG